MRKCSVLPPQSELLDLFSYDPESGSLRWKVSRSQRRAGDVAGSLKKEGYWTVGIHEKVYKAHRVIWKMVTGADPVEQIDHIDLNRSNNRWSNLREATGCQNMQNRRLHSNSTSGVKGVSYNKQESKWDAYIMANKKFILLGRFTSQEQAANIVASARSELHGEFARLA